MSSAGTSAIALHVEAAKRLLDELEQHADSALRALGSDDTGEFLAAVEERDRVLAELNDVVEALAHERLSSAGSHGADAELLAEMAQAASDALESHETLMARTQQERNRLAAALEASKRPDSIAHQYSVASGAPRRTTLSVTG
jgi:hypothetical protein